MIKRISFIDFYYEFKDYDRLDNFSYEALQELYNYYDEIEKDIGEPIELDVIAICCEWTEYDVIDFLKERYTEPSDLEGIVTEEFMELLKNDEDYIHNLDYDDIDTEAFYDYLAESYEYIYVSDYTFLMND